MEPKLRPPGRRRLKLKCGAPLSNIAFKFNVRRYIGGQLVGFGVRPGLASAGGTGAGGDPAAAAADKPGATQLTVMRVATEEEAAASQEFEGAVATGGGDALKGFCDVKRGEAQVAAAAEDAETWGFLGILFEVGTVYSSRPPLL